MFQIWLRGQDLNLRPSGYEPDELPGCSTPRQNNNAAPCFEAWTPRAVRLVKRDILDRPGNDLLSRVLRHSTISAEKFNGRVRDGIGFWLLAQATGPAKNMASKIGLRFQSPPVRQGICVRSWSVADIDHENDQADRAISTGKLSTLLHLHTRPINVVVFHGSQGISRFEVGFPLRCIQRLSRPYIATLHCGWRHNRSTRGTSTPVLSY